jgi:tetratricopeptide (TPR) repeat protein
MEEANDAFDKAIELNDDYAWAYAHRGATRNSLGDYEGALDDLNKAIEKYQARKGPTPWVYAHLGETYRLKYIRDRHRKLDQFLEEDFNNAIQNFTDAIELDPDYTWAYAHRAATYRLRLPHHGHKDDDWMQHWNKALNDLNQAIDRSQQTYAWAYAFRSTIYKLGGEYSKAFKDLMKALEIDMDSVKNPAVSEAKMRSIPEAEAEINMAHSVLKETICSALCSLAGLAVLEGDRASARFFLAHATFFDESYATDRSRNDPILKELKFNLEKDSSKYLDCIKHFEQEVTKS